MDGCFGASSAQLEGSFSPPVALTNEFGRFRSPLIFDDGRKVLTPQDWTIRRQEIVRYWHSVMGTWPPLLTKPSVQIVFTTVTNSIRLHRVRLEIAADRFEEGWLLVPTNNFRRPAVLVPFYEPETSIGRKGANRDFAWQLARRGFVTLSIGSPGGDARKPDPGIPKWQPLSFLAYVAANACTALAQRPDVDPNRIGIVGHSYGGKWALFAGAFDQRFACVVVSDPGIVWDETRPNVNYWEPWYLGRTSDQSLHVPGLISGQYPRTGAYKTLVDARHDLIELHALIAPRPFLVSGGAEDQPERWTALNHRVALDTLLGFSNRVAMTSRPTHDPTPESNAVIYDFFEKFLGDASIATR